MQADAIVVLLHSSILLLNRVYTQAYLRDGGIHYAVVYAMWFA